MPRPPEEVVLGFLLDVRSGHRPQRAGAYLAPRVRAHQGRPGAVTAVVTRSPEQYAEHVREMLSAVGPWTFEVLGLARRAGLVEAAWRQTGTVVEHGRAGYRVRDGRITEYWIEFSQDAVPGRAAPLEEGA
ncbi:nuclear transport factor 2 family protein [Geodermatophilus sp. SYSU D00815]